MCVYIYIYIYIFLRHVIWRRPLDAYVAASTGPHFNIPAPVKKRFLRRRYRKIGLQSTKSGAGLQFLLKDCQVKARTKGVSFHRHWHQHPSQDPRASIDSGPPAYFFCPRTAGTTRRPGQARSPQHHVVHRSALINHPPCVACMMIVRVDPLQQMSCVCVCVFLPSLTLSAGNELPQIYHSRECLSHHRKGTPGIGNVNYVFNVE